MLLQYNPALAYPTEDVAQHRAAFFPIPTLYPPQTLKSCSCIHAQITIEQDVVETAGASEHWWVAQASAVSSPSTTITAVLLRVLNLDLYGSEFTSAIVPSRLRLNSWERSSQCLSTRHVELLPRSKSDLAGHGDLHRFDMNSTVHALLSLAVIVHIKFHPRFTS